MKSLETKWEPIITATRNFSLSKKKCCRGTIKTLKDRNVQQFPNKNDIKRWFEYFQNFLSNAARQKSGKRIHGCRKGI